VAQVRSLTKHQIDASKNPALNAAKSHAQKPDERPERSFNHRACAETYPREISGLAALFKDSAPVSPAAASSAPGLLNLHAREALSHYNHALERLKAGDWAGFGVELDALRPLLERLSQGQNDQ
jgi:hypothetical protein